MIAVIFEVWPKPEHSRIISTSRPTSSRSCKPSMASSRSSVLRA